MHLENAGNIENTMPQKGFMSLWGLGVVVLTTAQFHLTKPDLWFSVVLNPA